MDRFLLIDGQQRAFIESSQLEQFFRSFHLQYQPTSKVSCRLCNLNLEKDNVLYNSEDILIIDTYPKKGHRERIMVLTKEHGVEHPEGLLSKAIQQLISVGQEIFTADFALLSDKFSSIQYHWHIIATDLDPQSEDYRQILETPFILVTKTDRSGKEAGKRGTTIS